MKVELLAAIVNWHLPPFPMAVDVAVALPDASGGQTMCMWDTAAVTCDFADLMRHLLNGVTSPTS